MEAPAMSVSATSAMIHEPEKDEQVPICYGFEDKVIGRIDRTNMAGPVYVGAFFGMMTPVFSWWGNVVVTFDLTHLSNTAASTSESTAESTAAPVADSASSTESTSASANESASAKAKEEAEKKIENSLLARISRAQELLERLDDTNKSILKRARILDNFDGGLLLQLFLGDEPLQSTNPGSWFAVDVPGVCGQVARTVAIGQDSFDNVRNNEFHCMTTAHRFGVFDVCDALATQGLRLHLVAETIPELKLIEVPTRAEYNAKYARGSLPLPQWPGDALVHSAAVQSAAEQSAAVQSAAEQSAAVQ